MSRDCRIVVIGHSLRDEGSAVVDAGLRFARALGARAEVIHAVTPLREQQRGAGAIGDSPGEIHSRFLRELESDIAGRAEASGLNVQCHVATGPPEVVLDSVAGSLDADVIVVGPAEPGALARGALGSSTRKLLRTAQYPVLVVRGELVLPPRLVVAAVDFSRPSMWGLRLAEDLVASLRSEKGAPIEIEVFTVLSDNDVQEPLDGAELEDFVAGQLREWVDATPAARALTTEIEVRRGDPETRVLEEIEGRSPDLVVVGSSGKHEAHHRDRLGRVAAKLALEAPSSVLFVPPRAAEALEASTATLWQAIDVDAESGLAD